MSWLTFAAALGKDAFPSFRRTPHPSIASTAFADPQLTPVLPHFPFSPVFDTLKTLLSTLAVPIEGLVSLLYWGMRLVDPSLLVPPDATFMIPPALDLAIHALPAAFLWADFLCFSPRMSARVRPNRIAAGATAGYAVWMEYAARRNARGTAPFFPYPL